MVSGPERANRMIMRDPQEMEEVMTRSLDEAAHIRPSKGSRFQARLDMFRLKHLSLFTVRANSIHAQMFPPHNFVAVNVPLDSPFSAKVGPNNREFIGPNAHFLGAEEPLDCVCHADFAVLACCFFLDAVTDYACKLVQADDVTELKLNRKLPLVTPPGIALQRSLAKAWSWLHSVGGHERQPGMTEIEDDLMSQFVQLFETGRKNQRVETKRPAYLKKAEE